MEGRQEGQVEEVLDVAERAESLLLVEGRPALGDDLVLEREDLILSASNEIGDATRDALGDLEGGRGGGGKR